MPERRSGDEEKVSVGRDEAKMEMGKVQAIRDRHQEEVLDDRRESGGDGTARDEFA
jgi:hypothetical protein